MNLIVLPPVNGDVVAALTWFITRRQYGHARDLDAAYYAALGRIEATPRLYSPVQNAPVGYEVREFYIRRFRYRVIYYITGNDVRVLALVHAHQHDSHWLNRLPPP